MLNLIRQNLLHIARTRLLILIIIFSFLIHFVGLQIAVSATVQFDGVVSRIGAKNGMMLVLFFQLFTGTFLSAVYGIWMIPYAHQGSRSGLTFTLPTSKWNFAPAYAVSFMVLLLIQQAVMIASYGMVFGFATLLSEEVSWAGLGVCSLIQTLAFLVFVFGFALSSMSFGQIPTFFLGVLTFFSLQVIGVVAHEEINRHFEGRWSLVDWLTRIHKVMPPVGDLVFDLRRGFSDASLGSIHLTNWIGWLVILVALFRLRLSFPSRSRGIE